MVSVPKICCFLEKILISHENRSNVFYIHFNGFYFRGGYQFGYQCVITALNPAKKQRAKPQGTIIKDWSTEEQKVFLLLRYAGRLWNCTTINCLNLRQGENGFSHCRRFNNFDLEIISNIISNSRNINAVHVICLPCVKIFCPYVLVSKEDNDSLGGIDFGDDRIIPI